MYLFIYGKRDGLPEYAIVGGYDNRCALQNLYEYVGGYCGISSDMFYDMIRNLPFAEAITVFNALRPSNKIEKVFSGLQMEYGTEET